jgi:hypothetical protein
VSEVGAGVGAWGSWACPGAVARARQRGARNVEIVLERIVLSSQKS